ncbi:hypothetical protein HN832_02195 [archaeon]|jgi:hypothetical protein|nr:hypothetical protein [archaeon]MBT4373165.1 hypothetical protein [archaeon]MBT4531510.1 hypothetical protein [archaeon]MBT7001312.1 hypothetical protein [archaeon]MBT7282202.1 hypothetical protein [archaeon]
MKDHQEEYTQCKHAITTCQKYLGEIPVSGGRKVLEESLKTHQLKMAKLEKEMKGEIK